MYTTAATYGTEQDRMIFGEKSDHLGNVRAVVSDIRKPTTTTGDIDDWTWQADITDHFSYYPFGMLEPGRQKRLNTLDNGGYRFGYQGSEKDDEITGSTGTHYTTYFRMLDTRIGRWWSYDPKFQLTPWIGPYISMGDNPLLRIDPKGDTDFTFDEESGDFTQVGEENDDPDRILKTDRKGNIKRKGEGFLGFLVSESERGKAKVAMDDIAPGILSDGLNFKNNDVNFLTGDADQPSHTDFTSFMLDFSNYVGKEISFFGFVVNRDKIAGFHVFKYMNNTVSTAQEPRIDIILNVGGKFYSLQVHGHTHPRQSNGESSGTPSKDDDNHKKAYPGIDHFIKSYDDGFTIY